MLVSCENILITTRKIVNVYECVWVSVKITEALGIGKCSINKQFAI
jgi:hypothetical protein